MKNRIVNPCGCVKNAFQILPKKTKSNETVKQRRLR